MTTETFTLARLSNKDFALKLLEWHGGQHTGLYSVGSCVLALAIKNEIYIPDNEVLNRAIKELEAVLPTHENKAEAVALREELLRRFLGKDVLDEFTRGYIECAFWSTDDEHSDALSEHYTVADLAPNTLLTFARDCSNFQNENRADLEVFLRAIDKSASYAGHDFWLARNGHGCDFRDRRCGLDEVEERLSRAARKFNECNLYVGDDHLLYL